MIANQIDLIGRASGQSDVAAEIKKRREIIRAKRERPRGPDAIALRRIFAGIIIVLSNDRATDDLQFVSDDYDFVLERLGEAEDAPLAVYKPRAGERPLWDFPEGTLCAREVAASVVARELGWPAIPRTDLVEGPVFTRPATWRGIEVPEVLLGGIGIGAVAVALWWISGVLGHLAEHPETLEEVFLATNSRRMESFTFAI